MDERSYDGVVVGSGLAGLAATLEAGAAGASVLLVEGQAAIGGSSALSGGIVMGAGTSVQKSAGIDDAAAALYRDYLLFSQHSVRPALARRLAEGSAPAIEWLVSHGVEFLDELVYAAEEPVPRSHVTRRGGRGIVKALAAAVQREANIDVAMGRRVDRLLTAGDHVCGVAVGDDEVGANAVVLATGGFGPQRSLWARLPARRGSPQACRHIRAVGCPRDSP